MTRAKVSRISADGTLARSVPEWVGASPDSKVPDHVRLRIFNRHGGICHIAKRKIMAGEPWDLDHVKALINGGEHRETNLRPALRDKHREKTADDVGERAKTERIRTKHLGLKSPSRGGFNKQFTKGFDGQVRPRNTNQEKQP